jgi:hypothetical protein
MPRVTDRSRRDLERPLAEDSTGSWFERYAIMPYVLLGAILAFASGLVVIAMLSSLK